MQKCAIFLPHKRMWGAYMHIYLRVEFSFAKECIQIPQISEARLGGISRWDIGDVTRLPTTEIGVTKIWYQDATEQ